MSGFRFLLKKIPTLLAFLNDEGNEKFKMVISTRHNVFLL